MKTRLYEVISGNDIFKMDEEECKPIVEGILYEDDYMGLVAESKMGKTILSQQLACAISVGKPFLGVFDVPKPLPVWYFATEGKKAALKDRFIRMRKAVEVRPENLKLIPCNFRFNTPEGWGCVQELMKTYKDELPKVIIIDALYRAIKGTLKNDDIIGEFHYNMDKIRSHCKCAIVLVHHMTKATRNKDGDYYSRSDIDTYGSAFILGGLDHILWLEKFRGEGSNPAVDKMLKCDNQRSGDIISNIRIQLQTGAALYYESIDRYHEQQHKVLQLLKTYKEMTWVKLESRSEISRTILYQVIKQLELKNQVQRSKGRPVIITLLDGVSDEI